MSSPSLGYTPSHLSTSITSALGVSHSSVRRRVSGSHPASGGGAASTGPLEVPEEGERYEKPSGDAHKAILQRKLPTLGRELFSDDEDIAMAHAPPPAMQDRAHPLPPIPTDVPQSNCPSPRTEGSAIPRLPTPNFAAVHKSSGCADDANMFGLLSKFTQPFKTSRGRPSSEARECDKIEDGTVDKGGRVSAGAGHGAVALGAPRTELTNTAGSCVPNRDLAPNLPVPRMPDQAATTAFSVPPGTTIRLVDAELTSQRTRKPTPSDTEDENQGEGGAESDGESSTRGILRRRRPPRSPTLLAAIHGATDRFTRRFPVSMSYQKANGREGDRGDQHLLGLLGYGETGAVVEWPNAWTPEKWSLLFSVCSVFIYGLAGLLLVLMTWFGVWHHSIIIRIIDYDILVTITGASLILLGTSIFGICGTLLNSRPLLAMYCVLLWPSFIGMLVIGYSAYRRAAFALPNKLDQAWSQKWGDEDRMILQYSLHCCGYWSPEHEAALSPLCYTRATLPGCKARLLRFERASLRRYYTWVFALVPLHILNIITGILCSNHVNRLFGKGLTPWQYRLSIADVRANALRVLETYRDTLIPPQPGRVYAFRSRHLEDGTSRSPRIPQGDGSPDPQVMNGLTGNGWTGRMPYDSVGRMFGFRGGRVKGVDEERAS